jgi:hypothetical protein
MSVLIGQFSTSIKLLFLWSVVTISLTYVEENGSITSLVNDVILEHFVIQRSWFLNSRGHVDCERVL